MFTIPRSLIQNLQREARLLPQEIGYILSPDPGNPSLLIPTRRIIGADHGFVTIPGDHPVTAHTHPISLYGDLQYHPPSDMDYIQSIWDAIRGVAEWNVVVEPNGTWTYRPNTRLITRLVATQPNIRSILGGPLREGELMREMSINENLGDMLDALRNNLGTEGIALAQPPEVLDQIADANGGFIPEGFAPISVAQYIDSVSGALNGRDQGFEVLYYPGSTPVELPVRAFENRRNRGSQRGGRKRLTRKITRRRRRSRSARRKKGAKVAV